MPSDLIWPVHHATDGDGSQHAPSEGDTQYGTGLHTQRLGAGIGDVYLVGPEEREVERCALCVEQFIEDPSPWWVQTRQLCRGFELLAFGVYGRHVLGKGG